MSAPFENDEKIKRDFSYSDILLLIKILNSKKEITYESNLARELKCHPQRIYKIIKYLKEISVIVDRETLGSNKIIEINFHLLKHFIDEQDILTWLDSNFLNKYNKYTYKEYPGR